MGAMDAWGLMDASSLQRPALQGCGTGMRVIVLGAGISGLVVGYEFGKLGYDYQVFEAREWVGGLCWTIKRGATHTEIDGATQVCQFDEGLYLNGGAWRLPNADTGVLGYCAELGVRLEIFVDATDANYFYEESPELGPLSGRKVRLREVKADLWGSTSELLATAIDQGQIDAPLSTEDKERLVSFLVRAGYLDTEDHVYRPPSSRGSADRHDLGALLQTGFGTRVRSLYAGTGGPAPVFQPVGGIWRSRWRSSARWAAGSRSVPRCGPSGRRRTAFGWSIETPGPGRSRRRPLTTASAVSRRRCCSVSTSPCRPR